MRGVVLGLDRVFAIAHNTLREAVRSRVVAAFREKYGFSDAMISVIRGSNPRIMALAER